MRFILVRIAQTALAILVLAFFVPTVILTDWVSLLTAAVVLTFFQLVIKPILNILTLPVNIVTLGFFSMLINVFLVYLATQVVPGFEIRPTLLLGIQLGYFGSLILVSFLLSIAQSFVSIFIK